MRHTRFDILIFIVSLLLAAGGWAGVRRGDVFGWVATGFFLLCAAAMAAAPWLRARQGKVVAQTVTVDDWGVRRTMGDLKEAVAWTELTEVSIFTTSEGPFVDDLFFVLRGAGESGVVVSQELAAEHKLLENLQARLPDLDNETVIGAMGSTGDARFVIWPPADKEK